MNEEEDELNCAIETVEDLEWFLLANLLWPPAARDPLGDRSDHWYRTRPWLVEHLNGVDGTTVRKAHVSCCGAVDGWLGCVQRSWKCEREWHRENDE